MTNLMPRKKPPSKSRPSTATRPKASRALQTQLRTLEATGLIRQLATQPELEYFFRHALMQEATYDTLVKQDRRQLHRIVGETLERLYPERAEELAPLLANHFYEAHDLARALKYLTQAGDFAARKFANGEALLHYGRALNLVAPTDGDEITDADPAQLTHLFSAYGRALEMSGQYDAALQTYARMEALARERGDQRMELAALVARGTVHSAPTSRFDPEQAQALADAALELARALDDRAAEARVLWNLALMHKFGAQWRDVMSYGERAASIARQWGLREQLAYILNDIHMAYLYGGQPQYARELLGESRQIWKELGHTPMLADNLASSALVEYSSGEVERAIEYARESYRLAVSINNFWNQAYALGTLSNALSERGDCDESFAASEKAVELGMRAGFEIAQVFVYAVQALLYGSLGAYERGLARARVAIRTAEEKFPAMRAMPLSLGGIVLVWSGDIAAAEAQLARARKSLEREDELNFILTALMEGELLLAKGAYTEALAATSASVARARAADIRGFLAWLLMLRGKALAGLERWVEAREVLQAARTATEAYGSRRTLWRVLLALGDVEVRLGNEAAAQHARADARGVIDYIAAHISEPEIRAGFLQQSGVSEVVSTS